jgi:hypothetical protein
MTQSSLWKTKDHDISMGVTSEDIQGVTPISIGSNPVVGQEILLLGYGCSTITGELSDGKLRAGKSKVTEVQQLRFYSDSNGGALLCPGDSGGPAFFQSGTSLLLLGVNSTVGVTDDGKTITGPNSNARLDGTDPQAILKAFAKSNSVDICGVTKNCAEAPPADPSCTLASTAESVEQGSPITLTLSSTNAVTAQIDGVSVAVPTGQRVLTPQSVGNQTSQGTVTAANGKTATCSKTYLVTPKANPSVACTLTATPSIVKVGETLTLELKSAGPVSFASIDGTQVSIPSGMKSVSPRSKGDYSAEGLVTGPAGASATCSAQYRVEAGIVIPPDLPFLSVLVTYCGTDANSAKTGISRVCLGTLKKDPSLSHAGFSDVITVAFSDGSSEVLPILARRPVGGSSLKDELGLFANKVVSGNEGATLDMRFATVSKNASGTPLSLEGSTMAKKNFRASLTPQ